MEESSTATRKAAMAEALTQVLVRLTGERKPQDNPRSRPLLEQAESYVQQFAYAQRPLEPDPDAAPDAKPPAPQLVLKGQFAQRPLNAAIRQAGLPIWGEERPILMAAILVPGDSGPRLLDSGLIEAWPVLGHAATDRGVPLQLPDTAAVPLDVAQNPASPLLAAVASSNEAEILLWGQLTPQDNKWVLQAELRAVDSVDQPPIAEWHMRSREPEPLLREAMQRSADWLASEHALAAYVPGGESIVGLWVRGVSGEEQYRQIEEHLRQLPGVDQLSLVAVVDGALVFRASTEVDAGQLDENIRRAGKLEPESLPPGAGTVSVWTGEYEYHYRVR